MRASTASCAVLVTAVMAAMTMWPTRPANVRLTAQEPTSPPTGIQKARSESPEHSIEAHNAETEQKLAQTVEAVFDEMELQGVLDFVSEWVDVRFHVKPAARDQVRQKTTIHLNRIRADMLLDLIFSEVGMTYVVQDGIVFVSTEDDLQNATDVRVYNCRDLLHPTGAIEAAGESGGHMGHAMGMAGGGLGGMMSGGMMGGGAGGMMGGGAGMMPGGGPASGGGAAYAGGIPGGMVGGGLGTGGGGDMASGPGGMMGGPMGGSGGPGGMTGMGMGMGMPAAGQPSPEPANEYDVRVRRLVHVLTTAIEPASWQGAGGYATATEYGGLLVINHNVRAHRKIEKLLKMLRDAAHRGG